jgi:hypothetical protein
VGVHGGDGDAVADLHVGHRVDLAEVAAHVLQEQVGLGRPILGGAEELVDPAREARRLGAGPVLVELGVEVIGAVAHPDDREGTAGGLDLGPVDVSLPRGDIHALQGAAARTDLERVVLGVGVLRVGGRSTDAGGEERREEEGERAAEGHAGAPERRACQAGSAAISGVLPASPRRAGSMRIHL